MNEEFQMISSRGEPVAVRTPSTPVQVANYLKAMGFVVNQDLACDPDHAEGKYAGNALVVRVSYAGFPILLEGKGGNEAVACADMIRNAQHAKTQADRYLSEHVQPKIRAVA